MPRLSQDAGLLVTPVAQTEAARPASHHSPATQGARAGAIAAP
jgi:hypothetical protein